MYDSVYIRHFKLLPMMVRNGGVDILVRKYLNDPIKVVKISGENFYWFTCSDCADILFCVMYIPPEGSNSSDIAIVDNLEYDLIELCQNENYHICLLGDFNRK